MSDYRLIAKVKNDRILSLIELYGYNSVHQFCVQNNFGPTCVGDIINFKMKPLTKKGVYRKIVERIADALRVHPDALFTESQRTMMLERNVAETTFGESRFLELCDAGDGPETLLLEDESRREFTTGVHDMLSKLTPREKNTMELLYGMDDDGKRKTLHTVSEELDVSPERVRQVEAKAFRKLRMRFAGNEIFDDYTKEYREYGGRTVDAIY